jgi:sporulation related protein
MSNRERFLTGGVGGLAPVLMFLVTRDFERFFSNIAVAMILGYLIRASIVFFIGGFVASLYRDETQRLKVFQLGLAGPAMIAGFLSASPTAPAASVSSVAGFLVAVHAQAAANGDNIKQFTLPDLGPVDQFFEGLTGAQPKNVWFVIAAAFSSVDKAKAYAASVNKGFPGFHADVYGPYHTPYYSVVIGAHLTQAEAKALRDKAVSAGLPKETYFDIPRDLPPAPAAK